MTAGMIIVAAGGAMLGWNVGEKSWGNAVAGALFVIVGFMIP